MRAPRRSGWRCSSPPSPCCSPSIFRSTCCVGAMASDRAAPPASPTAARRLGRLVLIAAAASFLVVFLVVPLAVVFGEALAKGLAPYLAALPAPDARAAVRLTLLVAAIAVPLNTAFGIAAAWS